MQTINEISTQSSLELPLSNDGLIDISQCMKHSIVVFWNRRLAHVKASLAMQERQNVLLAAHGEARKANRYLDNSNYFQCKAPRIADGYNSWIGKTLNAKPDLAMDMNLYLNNKCPYFNAIDSIPVGLHRFLMMMIPKITFFRASFGKYAPEVMQGCRGEHANERKYEFSSALFYNVINLLAHLWDESVQAKMEALLELPCSEQVVAVLEETVLNYDETRLQAERICTLKAIASADKLPFFADVKKQVMLFKAFLTLEQVRALNQLDEEEYNEQLRLFGEKWNLLSARKPGDDQTALDFDEMMVKVQGNMISPELKTAIYLKNIESGDKERKLKNKAKAGDEDANEALRNRRMTFISLEETDASGRPLAETIPDLDTNAEVKTSEDFTQEIWDGMNTNEKAYLILEWARSYLNAFLNLVDNPVYLFFAKKIGCKELFNVNGKDGFRQVFTEVTGCRDIPHVIVNNIYRQCIEKLTGKKLHSINSHNYDAIELQMSSLVQKEGIKGDLNENWGTLLVQCIDMHLDDEKDIGKQKMVNEVNEIVKKVIEVQQRRI